METNDGFRLSVYLEGWETEAQFLARMRYVYHAVHGDPPGDYVGVGLAWENAPLRSIRGGGMLPPADAPPDRPDYGELARIVKEIAAHEWLREVGAGGETWPECAFCDPPIISFSHSNDGTVTIGDYVHRVDCIWVRARQLAAGLPTEGTIDGAS